MVNFINNTAVFLLFIVTLVGRQQAVLADQKGQLSNESTGYEEVITSAYSMDNPIQTTELTSADEDLDSIPLPLIDPEKLSKVLVDLQNVVTENIPESVLLQVDLANLKSLKQTILLAGETENYIPCEVRDYATDCVGIPLLGAGVVYLSVLYSYHTVIAKFLAESQFSPLNKYKFLSRELLTKWLASPLAPEAIAIRKALLREIQKISNSKGSVVGKNKLLTKIIAGPSDSFISKLFGRAGNGGQAIGNFIVQSQRKLRHLLFSEAPQARSAEKIDLRLLKTPESPEKSLLLKRLVEKFNLQANNIAPVDGPIGPIMGAARFTARAALWTTVVGLSTVSLHRFSKTFYMSKENIATLLNQIEDDISEIEAELNLKNMEEQL